MGAVPLYGTYKTVKARLWRLLGVRVRTPNPEPSTRHRERLPYQVEIVETHPIVC